MTHDERLKFYQRKYLAATDERQKDRIMELFRKECKATTEEHLRKMNEAWKGKHHTEESRKKISEALKGKPSPRKGATLSEEHRRKLSEAAKLREARKRELLSHRELA